ncbi:MAG: hypothetical protein ACI4JB_00950 [Porcipelethomonas sp.]
MNNNKIQLRKLCSKDIFSMAGIISKCGISELKSCFSGVDAAGSDRRTVGMNIAFSLAQIICAAIPECENEIMEFMADLSGQSRDTLEKLPPAEFAGLVKALFEKDEFRDFFTVLSGSFLPAE